MTENNEHDRIEAEIIRTDASNDPFAAAVRATRMPMIITDPHQPDNPIIYANAAFTKLTGYTNAEILGKNCRFLQGHQTDREDVGRIRDAIERRVPIEMDLLNYKKNGEKFWNRLLVSPVFNVEGALTYYFASQFDVTLEKERLVRLRDDRDALEREVERRITELRQSEEQLRFILKAGRLGSWTLNLSDLRLVASDTCKDNFGRAPSDTFTYDDLVSSIADRDRPRMQAAVQASIDGGHDYDIEYQIITPKAEVRWLQIRGQTFYRADGSPISMAGVSLDITDRKRSEEHRRLLTEELNHRVKNVMATMQSIANQTLRSAKTLNDARSTLAARVRSLADANDVLTRESWEGATLAEIVESALTPFKITSVDRFSVGGPSIRLPPRLALAFAMAFHELATNAVKYGALANETGRVILNWDVMDGSRPDRFWVRWEEIGGPPVTPPTRSGFGTRMIERALAAELGGTAETEYKARGVVFRVDAPLPDLRME